MKPVFPTSFKTNLFRGVPTIVFFCILIGSGDVFAQCLDDVKLSSKKGDIYYQSRGNYCEGYIAKPMSNPALTLVQYTLGDLEYDLKTDDILTIRIATPAINNAQLTAAGKKSKDAYRLDGSISKSVDFEWDLNAVIKKEGLHSDRVGIFGYYDSGLPRKDPKVYVPVVVQKTNSRLSDPEKKSITLRPGSHMADIKWKLKRKGKDITKLTRIPKGNSSFFGRNQIIKVILPDKTSDDKEITPGEYELEIRFRKKGSERWVIQQFNIII